MAPSARMPMMAGSTGRFTTGRIYDCIRIRSPRRSCSFLLTSGRSPYNPIYPRRSSRREQVADRSPARCAAALSVTTVWLGRSDCSRRDTRQSVKRFGSGPIGGGDSPLTHRPPGYRHDVHGRADQSAAAVIVQHARGRAVFPRRRTGAKSQPTPSSLRQGAPVNRRYGHVEDALD